jgi:hypothetical protein
MPVYVIYQGRIIAKQYRPSPPQHAMSELPAPAVQSFESYLSPINDNTVSSARQRERDLLNSGSYDPRDTPVEFKKARDVRQQQQRRRPVTTEP